eukprot:jgi/Chrzof1/6332/Cz18g04170.t1
MRGCAKSCLRLGCPLWQLQLQHLNRQPIITSHLAQIWTSRLLTIPPLAMIHRAPRLLTLPALPVITGDHSF